MGLCCLEFYDFLEYFGYPVFGTETCRTNLDSLELWSISGWFDCQMAPLCLDGPNPECIEMLCKETTWIQFFFRSKVVSNAPSFGHVQRIHWIHWIHQIQGPNLPAGHECLWLSSGWLLLCLDSVQGTRIQIVGRRSFAAKWRGKVWCLRAYPQISSVPHGWRGLQRFFPGLWNTDGQRLAITFVQTGWHGWRAENKHQVFGGILGNVIENEDGSYGSDDRTSEIRARLSLSKLTRCASRGRPVTWASEHWLDIDTDLY